MIQAYRKVENIHRRGLAANRPPATDVLKGTLYFSTDTGFIERSNGTSWEVYSGSGGGAGAPPYDLEYLGQYIPGTYNDGDIVVGPDGITYICTKDGVSTPPEPWPQQAGTFPLHHTTHELNGTDPIKLDALNPPDDTTKLDVSTARHGLMPKLSGRVGDVMTGVGTFMASGSNIFNGTINEIPPNLDSSNAGLIYMVLQPYNHLLRWNGSIWEFAPGDCGNGFFCTRAIPPQESGWAKCDGSITDYLVVGGPTITTAPFTTPNMAGVYMKGIGAYTGVINPAVPATLSGVMAAAGAHGHVGVTDSQGGHGHTASASTAGGHSHPNSYADWVPDHGHTGSTGSGGSHTHGGSTSVAGYHAHNMANAGAHSHRIVGANYLASGGGISIQAAYYFDGAISTDGNHAHDIAPDGNHNHGLSMDAAGDHTHGLSINPGGTHYHNLLVSTDGAHSHTVGVDAVGGHSHNIAATAVGDHTHGLGSLGVSGGEPANIGVLVYFRR